MFYYQNSTIGPNLLAGSIEEDEERSYKRRNRVFRDVGNEQPQRSKTDIITTKPTWQNAAEVEKQGEGEFQEEIRKMFANKKTNFIMHFSSDEDEEDAEKHSQEVTERELDKQVEDFPTAKTHLQGQFPQAIQVPKKNIFLLAFSDEQKSQEEISQNEAIPSKQTITSSHNPSNNNKNNLILNFQSEQQEEAHQKPSIQRLPSQKNNKNTLTALINRAKDKFYLQPIDESLTLQCIVKRQRTNLGIQYQIHDSVTLRNIMTIEKTDDGYLIISKYAQFTCNSQTKGDTVVGRLLSNFFGTEFNCYLWSYPFKKFAEYTVDPNKSKQTITIQYQTNIFGLKGPRRMAAYIPIPPSNAISDGVVSKKRLNQLYQQQNKKKLPPTIQKFRNKTPKWNSSIDAYVLNFYGRATVSSIKNFIIIKEEEGDDAQPSLLFGKFGKDLFNLDIRHPFNLLQGVALALSSFDKKLACQ